MTLVRYTHVRLLRFCFWERNSKQASEVGWSQWIVEVQKVVFFSPQLWSSGSKLESRTSRAASSCMSVNVFGWPSGFLKVLYVHAYLHDVLLWCCDYELFQDIMFLILFALFVVSVQVLIFSQMTSILDILMDYCYLRGFQYSRLDGSMSYADRDENVNLKG